ncbi:carboxylesterase BioH [Luminiphilus syltensis NOR5-1B]|uniref:Carboxylesterase BioH n=1 Tax=Luminiphilus syltensis NOR5-1B TaxID=565045 RepID=B8KQG3_9GAMM|nr:alpha/beta hydrolase [Luminiphilus syltensis]EED34898.1 carboxylesterase BioH [Luminiphilus syltensis NOR5-1B]
MAYLTVEDNKQVYFEDYGSGDTAIVLIHAWGMSSRTWDSVLLPLLDAGHRVITIDHRGCGRSDHDFADLSISAIASDVAKLVEDRGLNKVVLNGWSLGGAVATQAAHLLGDRCAGMVLTAGATPVYTQKPDLDLGGAADDVRGIVAAMNADRVNFLSQLSHAVCAKPVSSEMTDWMSDIFIASSARSSSTLGELADIDQREILLDLNVPILSYVCGQDGFVAPGIARWVVENHPRAEGVELPDSGHAPFIEEPEAYMDALKQFLAGL